MVLHVGFPKTATTALQDHVFAGLEGVRNLGKPDFTKPVKKALRRIVNVNPNELEPHAAEPLVRAIDSGNEPALVSHEGFTSTRREIRGEARPLRQAAVRAQRQAVARRLWEACRDYRTSVVFTVREQCRWMLSLYGDLVHRECIATPFEQWVEDGLADPAQFLGDPDFHSVVAAYAALFGEDRVHVLAFEDLASNPRRFAEGLAAAGGLDPEPIHQRLLRLPRSKSGGEVAADPDAFRAGNPREGKLRTPSQARVPEDVPPRLVPIIRDYCRTGNVELVARFGAPLAAFDYAL